MLALQLSEEGRLDLESSVSQYWLDDPHAIGGTSVGGTAFLYLRPEEKTVVAFATNLSL